MPASTVLTVGTSYGGFVALNLAVRTPERVASLSSWTQFDHCVALIRHAEL